MLSKINYTSVCGQSQHFVLYMSNKITGCNGSGKSTIKEAIALLFAGTDSVGTRAPVHLISEGDVKCKIDAVTTKAHISRSLTVDKRTVIKLDRRGVATTLRQADLDKALCSSDLFLSVFVPGYFLGLTPQKKHAVLAEAMPPVDRLALLEQLSGISLADGAKTLLIKTDRPDLVAECFAVNRRKLAARVQSSEGQLTAFSEVKPLDKPSEPAEVTMKQYLINVREEWSRYNIDHAAYLKRRSDIEAVKVSNEAVRLRRTQLAHELEGIKLAEVPTAQCRLAELNLLSAQLAPLPAKPAYGNVMDGNICNACGQIVNSKHRDRVREENEQRRKQYEAEAAQVETNNEGVREQIHKVNSVEAAEREKIEEIKAANTRLSTRRTKLEANLSFLKEAAVPEELTEPIKPSEEASSDETLADVMTVIENHTKAVAQYDYNRRLLEEASARSCQLRSQIEEDTVEITRLHLIEEALKALPQKEMELRRDALSIPGYILQCDDNDIQLLTSTGRPHQLLSAGEATKAYVALCLKLNSIMPKKVSMIFIDDADLMDLDTLRSVREMCSNAKVQSFFAHVENDNVGLTVKYFNPALEQE